MDMVVRYKLRQYLLLFFLYVMIVNITFIVIFGIIPMVNCMDYLFYKCSNIISYLIFPWISQKTVSQESIYYVQYYTGMFVAIALRLFILFVVILAFTHKYFKKVLFNPKKIIKQVYKNHNIDIKIGRKIKEGPQIRRYFLKIVSKNTTIARVKTLAEDLKVSLYLNSLPVITTGQGNILLDVPKKREFIYWKDVDKGTSKMSFPVGKSIDGQLIFVDMVDPNQCHLLIGGLSGSGKSELLKSIVSSLIYKNTTETLKITIIDPKLLTFTGLKQSKFLTQEIITDISQAIQALQLAVLDMDKRYEQLEKEGFENLNQRIRKNKKDIPYHVIIFDEFADLILSSSKEKKDFENLVARIAAKGRAAGVHLILATQRPDSKVVTGLIKANCPLKICLKVTSHINSKIILDKTGAENLLGKGDLFLDKGNGLERIQGLYISPNEIKELTTDKIDKTDNKVNQIESVNHEIKNKSEIDQLLEAMNEILDPGIHYQRDTIYKKPTNFIRLHINSALETLCKKFDQVNITEFDLVKLKQLDATQFKQMLENAGYTKGKAKGKKIGKKVRHCIMLDIDKMQVNNLKINNFIKG